MLAICPAPSSYSPSIDTHTTPNHHITDRLTPDRASLTPSRSISLSLAQQPYHLAPRPCSLLLAPRPLALARRLPLATAPQKHARHPLKSDTPQTPDTGSLGPIMCHNAVDGRFHILCKHFVPMNSTFVDCMRAACIYSSQHVHSSSGECNRACIKYMNPPAKNPIRLSQTSCPSCVPPPRVIL